VAAALPPASPLPTITIELPPLLSDTRHRPGCSFLPGKRVLALGPVAVGLYSFTVAWILGKIIDKTMGFRVSAEEEATGVDLTQHAETAYDFGTIPTVHIASGADQDVVASDAEPAARR